VFYSRITSWDGAQPATTRRCFLSPGWYHSHPRITVLPSHVDVRTQFNFQRLDSGFLGLIFSCYEKASDEPAVSVRQWSQAALWCLKLKVLV